MHKSTVLIVAAPDTPLSEVKGLLDGLSGAHVHVALFVAACTAPFPAYSYAASAYGPSFFPDEWQRDYQDTAKRIADQVDALETLLQDAGLEGDIASTLCEPSQIDAEIAARARLCDHVFVTKSYKVGTDLFDRLFGGLVFDSPTGVIVNAPNVAAVMAAKRPFVAWDLSLPATRAVHRALPILTKAHEVTIAVFDPQILGGLDTRDPGVDLAAWLSRHGCNVNVQQYPSGGQDTATAIQARAGETGADLVVMGAFVRSRARQFLMGGTTTSMVSQTDLPVLFAH